MSACAAAAAHRNWVAAALLYAAVAAAGCAPVARPAPVAAWAFAPTRGVSADIPTLAGLRTGAHATEAGCRARPNGLWVAAGERRECLLYAAAGTGRKGSAAVVFIPGDPMGATYMSAGGRTWIESIGGDGQHSAAPRQRVVDGMSRALGGAAAVVLSRPGMGGSSGNHADDRHTVAEVLLVDAALSQLRERFGFREFAVAGFSSGGVVAANLLPLRTDLRCTVLASAPLDLAAFYRGADGSLADHVAMRGDLADPMRSVATIRGHPTVWVIGDRRDRKVPPSSWHRWATAARQAGATVFEAEAGQAAAGGTAAARSFHHDAGPAAAVAFACAAGVTAAEIRRALLAGEAVPAPDREAAGAGAGTGRD